jgi:hypothetical protein
MVILLFTRDAFSISFTLIEKLSIRTIWDVKMFPGKEVKGGSRERDEVETGSNFYWKM